MFHIPSPRSFCDVGNRKPSQKITMFMGSINHQKVMFHQFHPYWRPQAAPAMSCTFPVMFAWSKSKPQPSERCWKDRNPTFRATKASTMAPCSMTSHWKFLGWISIAKCSKLSVASPKELVDNTRSYVHYLYVTSSSVLSFDRGYENVDLVCSNE